MNTYGLISLEEYHTAAFVAGCEIVSCGVELDGRDDVGCDTRYRQNKDNYGK